MDWFTLDLSFNAFKWQHTSSMTRMYGYFLSLLMFAIGFHIHKEYTQKYALNISLPPHPSHWTCHTWFNLRYAPLLTVLRGLAVLFRDGAQYATITPTPHPTPSVHPIPSHPIPSTPVHPSPLWFSPRKRRPLGCSWCCWSSLCGPWSPG